MFQQLLVKQNLLIISDSCLICLFIIDIIHLFVIDIVHRRYQIFGFYLQESQCAVHP